VPDRKSKFRTFADLGLRLSLEGSVPGQPALPMLLGCCVSQRIRKEHVEEIIENYDLKGLHLNVYVCQHVEFLYIGEFVILSGEYPTWPYIGSFDPA
jgi:hypothetical protein